LIYALHADVGILDIHHHLDKSTKRQYSLKKKRDPTKWNQSIINWWMGRRGGVEMWVTLRGRYFSVLFTARPIVGNYIPATIIPTMLQYIEAFIYDWRWDRLVFFFLLHKRFNALRTWSIDRPRVIAYDKSNIWYNRYEYNIYNNIYFLHGLRVAAVIDLQTPSGNTLCQICLYKYIITICTWKYNVKECESI